MRRVFVETPEFQKLCKKAKVKEEHIRALQNELLENPKKGALIEGSGGSRKIRVASDQKGKSGSFRVIYTDFSSYEMMFFWVVFEKSEADNITDDEKKVIKSLNQEIKYELFKKR